MAQLVPSILENSKEAFLDTYAKEVKLPGTERIQVDFCDNTLTPTQTLPVTEMEALSPAFHWEAHLMIREPNDFLDYQICGFKTIIVHYEAFESREGCLAALASIRSMGCKAGVAINPETEVSVLEGVEADQYLIMSVVPGKQGQSFIPSSIDKIQQLRSRLPHAIIEVDGGLNETNIQEVASAGADLLILGSVITKVQNMHAAYELLKSKLTLV